MYENLTGLEDQHSNRTGLYFLSYEVPFDGTLYEIEACGFTGDSFDPVNDTLLVTVLFYREIQNKIYGLRYHLNLPLNFYGTNNGRYGCKTNNLQTEYNLQLPVNKGDKVAIFVPHSQCSDLGFFCFAQPSLVCTNCSLALYFPTTSSDQTRPEIVSLENAIPVEEFINMNITLITGEH